MLVFVSVCVLVFFSVCVLVFVSVLVTVFGSVFALQCTHSIHGWMVSEVVWIIRFQLRGNCRVAKGIQAQHHLLWASFVPSNLQRDNHLSTWAQRLCQPASWCCGNESNLVLHLQNRTILAHFFLDWCCVVLHSFYVVSDREETVVIKASLLLYIVATY